MKILKFILFFLNIAVVIFTLLSYVSPFVNPERFWFFSYFGLAFIILLLLNLMFVIIWLFIDIKRTILSLSVLVVGAGFIMKTIAFNLNTHTENKDAIKVMSYNLNQGTYLYKNKKKYGSIAALVNRDKPSILLLQELNSERLKEDKKKFDFRYKYDIGNYGAGIYTDYKIVRKGIIAFGSLNTNSCLWADLEINGDTVRAYSVQFMSNHISDNAERILSGMEKNKKIEPGKIRQVLSKYKMYVRIRAKQVNKVRAHIDSCPYPVIVGGDFNDPPISYTYHQFAGFLKDAFLEKGRGLGVTYAGAIPFLRIDYIFVSKSLIVDGFYIDKSKKLSDHFPVIAYLGFSPNDKRRQQ